MLLLRDMSLVVGRTIAADEGRARRAGAGVAPRHAIVSLAALTSVAFIGAVALPLLTYTTALALFGFAHVASELRYVDHRFGARLGGGLAGQVAAILGAAVVARLAGMMGWLPPELTVGIEVALGALLMVVTLRHMRRRCWIGAAAAVVLVGGALLAPIDTLLVLAIAHNLTPLAFLAERLRGAARRRALAIAGIGFVGLPLLIATGLPFAWLAARGLVAPEATLFASGNLMRNMGAYVPAQALWSDCALHAFSASVFAQCLHYVAVIGVLPRLIDVQARPFFAWPAPRWLVIGGVALALGFALDWGGQRQVYALAALVHAWLELPVLALAASGQVQRQADAG
jgi:hypothetical protein